MNVDAITKQCVAVIKANLPDGHWRVWLFGSQAKGTASRSSDVDVAIAGDNPVPWKTMALIRSKISEIPTLRSIDVVDICSTDEELRKEILEYGQTLT